MGSCSNWMHRFAPVLENDLRASMHLRMVVGIRAMTPSQAQQSSNEVRFCILISQLDLISWQEEKVTYLWSEHRRVGVCRDVGLTMHKCRTRQFFRCPYHHS